MTPALGTPVEPTAAGTMRARLVVVEPDALVVRVADRFGERDLVYRSPEPVWAVPPPTLDFAAIALAQLAAARGEDLWLDGRASRAQLERLDEYLQIWSVWRPDLFRRIRVAAADEVDAVAHGARGGAAMGFSGGVDASFALAAHATGMLGRLTRSIDLGVLVVGWDLRHGDGVALERAWAAARESLGAYGARCAVVSTNWQQEFCADWFMSFTAGLAAVLHTFSGICSAAVHATDRSYRSELGMRPYGCHTMINCLLGTPHFPLISTGGTHERLERVAFLAAHPTLLERLRVCYQDGAAGGNCGRCEKCIRTQLELRACGLPTQPQFPPGLQPADVEAVTTDLEGALRALEEAYERLPPDDVYREALGRAVRRERLRMARQRGEAIARVADLEAALASAQAEREAMRVSRSWRFTAPLRALRSRVRLGAPAGAGRAPELGGEKTARRG